MRKVVEEILCCKMEEDRLITAVIVGAGNRGSNYAAFGLDFPERLKVVAVADPKETARSRIQKWFGLPEDRVFTDWEELASAEKMAECAVIATQDQMHKDPVVAFARKGYHILLEKPMAITQDDCFSIYQECVKNNVLLAVCHVLRYFPPVMKIKELIESGDIGDVVHIAHRENVGFWHFAHSFVRGNWRNSKLSTFSLLAKCCHDLDLIAYWMEHTKCVKVSSFGSLFHFRRENKPQGASSRCLNCDVEVTCPYSAKKIYLNSKPITRRWPMSVVCDIEDVDPKAYEKALYNELLSGPYGRCVYECDNDVCDNQVVNLSFTNGSTAALTMIAFTEKLCEREVKVFGTKGEITWNGEAGGPVVHYDFLSKQKRFLKVDSAPFSVRLQGHGGADFFLMDCFVKAVARGDPSYIRSAPKTTLESHLLAFAAEESRLKGEVVDFMHFLENLQQKTGQLEKEASHS